MADRSVVISETCYGNLTCPVCGCHAQIMDVEQDEIATWTHITRDGVVYHRPEVRHDEEN